MDPIVKLKMELVRIIKDKDDYAKKFRFALGAPGFLKNKFDSKKSILDLFKDLLDQGYYKENKVNILYRIFKVMEMKECLVLVEEYMRIYAPPSGEIPSSVCVREQPPTRETIEISDAYHFEISKKIPADRLSELAVVGFGLGVTEHNNQICDKPNNTDKILATLSMWKQKAPLQGESSDVPEYNKYGLRKALEDAKLNGVISDLKLHLL
ncbi:hypothetical protein LOD99_8472 [Oopsacas minuta]|uniref:Death domain-containing protein n=1 Tax=Oopsacas minuta TaxID=111878 RepID=A0AAV7JHI6_9METZ|nr:hypothetical protein LOD99_8472 [Oopsacas minuta]